MTGSEDEKFNTTKLREAFISVFRTPVKLKMFVKDSFQKNLAEISTGSDLEELAYELIDYYESEGLLYELYQKFYNYKNNRDIPCVAELQSDFCLSNSSIFATASPGQAELEKLFSILSSGDDYSLEVKRAFFQAFARVIGDFKEYRPDCKEPNSFQEISDFLELYYSSELIVTFAECLLGEIQKTNQPMNSVCSYFEELKQWRERFAQKYNVQPKVITDSALKSYLLISIQERVGNVNIYLQLKIGDEPIKPVDISADKPGLNCDFEEIPEYLPDWVKMVEQDLLSYSDIEPVTLEVFIQHCRFDENLAEEWKISKPNRNKPIPLKNARSFIVRSLDRVINRTLKLDLERKWKILENCVQKNDVLGSFCKPEACPSDGDLQSLLIDKPGLKLVIPLPDDEEEREDLFWDIIEAGVPIALWSDHLDCTTDERSSEFDKILNNSNLTDFADLAKQIRKARSESEILRNLKMLCDCPHRLPTIPTNKKPLTIPS
ncbi:MAG: effector-associated domain EAD1-containing protein [Cyanobacteria bacterium J06592_8]